MYKIHADGKNVMLFTYKLASCAEDRVPTMQAIEPDFEVIMH